MQFILCNHARAVWFGSNLGFLTYSMRSMDIVKWWENLMKLNGTMRMQENPNLPSMALTIWPAL